jgi:DNA-binding transcriptional ArsR family regulator
MSPRTAAAARSLRDAAPVFAALGDETRLRLVSRLCEQGPLSIARLTEGAEVTRQAVTKHLHVLASAGLVRGTREGRENVWELEPRRLEDARRWLDRISKQWGSALDRRKAFVER